MFSMVGKSPGSGVSPIGRPLVSRPLPLPGEQAATSNVQLQIINTRTTIAPAIAPVITILTAQPTIRWIVIAFFYGVLRNEFSRGIGINALSPRRLERRRNELVGARGKVVDNVGRDARIIHCYRIWIDSWRRTPVNIVAGERPGMESGALNPGVEAESAAAAAG